MSDKILYILYSICAIFIVYGLIDWHSGGKVIFIIGILLPSIIWADKLFNKK